MISTILIIDDDRVFRALLLRIIAKEGFRVLEAGDVSSALKVLEKEEEVNVVLSDVSLPDGNGVELTETIKTKYPCIEVIVITGEGRISDGVKAIKNGAFDYLVKGDDNDKLIPLLNKATEKGMLQLRIQLLEKNLNNKYGFPNIRGESEAILKAKVLAAKVALTDATVLLLGETGTGKEVFAQAIHYASPRKQKPFVAVNCSSFGKEILESELFGHKAGAFTGAVKDKRGYMAEASGGTLFLDEIGDMNIELQAKLLRVLETKEFYCVGDSKPSKADVRIVAATNRKLEVESEKGTFRADLFYRLSVFQIQLPSLNERGDDIMLLTHFFLQELSAKMNKQIPGLKSEFTDALKQHYWKGNIRELKNVIERALIVSDGQLTAQHLPNEFVRGIEVSPVFDMALLEKQNIARALEHTKGNKTKAALLMNISLTTLYSKLKEQE